MRFPTMWYVQPTKPQISLTVKLLTEHYLEFLSFRGGCTGSSESTLVKMPHCWKSHDMAQISYKRDVFDFRLPWTQLNQS